MAYAEFQRVGTSILSLRGLRQVIGQDAVENSLEALMHERGKAIRETIDMFEAAGSYDEEPYVSSDTESEEQEYFVEDA
jgi:hypothetical protein